MNTHDNLHLPLVAAAASNVNRTGTVVCQRVLPRYTHSNHYILQGHWSQNKYALLVLISAA